MVTSATHMLLASECGNAAFVKVQGAVKQALLSLKPQQQTVITLRFFERLKLNEIAEILGQNPATTRSQLSRALRSLKRQLQAAGQHGEVGR